MKHSHIQKYFFEGPGSKGLTRESTGLKAPRLRTTFANAPSYEEIYVIWGHWGSMVDKQKEAVVNVS